MNNEKETKSRNFKMNLANDTSEEYSPEKRQNLQSFLHFEGFVRYFVI